MELQLLIFGVCLLACGTVGTGDLKSSLTLVIDETDSMDTDIQELVKFVDGIVDTVSNSSSSPIEEYVLVTFNDDVKLVTKTNDKAALKENIDDINVGGEDSEKSLAGIELALNESRDGSLLFVFTDASAKDYNQSEKVQALSQKKGIQIVFLLTGNFQGKKGSIDYLVYHEIAKATNGQVFHLQKQEIGEILKYVENTVQSRKNIIASKTFPAGEESAFDVNVDGDTNELVIAVSGESPSVSVTTAGAEVNATKVTWLHEIAVIKFAVKPGVYRVKVASRTDSSVVVSASTSVHFQHGFSIIAPSSIADTTRRPVPSTEDEEVKSYLSIQLGPGGANVKLNSVQILNMDDDVLLDQPLQLVDKEEQFYITEPFIPPDEMFKIAIKGYDTKKEINVTRYGLTPIEAQSFKEQPIGKKPEVTIVGAPIINAHYYKPLKLKCKISGWSTPDVLWKSDDASEKPLHTKVSRVEIPYEYISVLEIHKVTRNTTYTCEATNSEDTSSNNVTIQTVETEFIEVEVEDTTIEYQKPGKIECKVNAYPPATVSWYRSRSPLKSDDNLQISDDGSITIQSMEPKMAGIYYCMAKNAEEKIIKPVNVKISGVGPPKIDKTKYQLNAAVGESVGIFCNITSTPNATVQWSYKNATTAIALNETSDTINLSDIEATHAGIYSCKAQNEFGVDYHGIELIVTYEPTISGSSSYERQKVIAVEGHMVILNCSSDGVPAPDITWTHRGRPLDTTRHSLYTNGSLGFAVVSTDEGTYTCEAKNELGNDAITIVLEVITPTAVRSPQVSIIDRQEGATVALNCIITQGQPQPNITWLYRRTPKADIIKLSHTASQLNFPRIQHGQSGEYTCVATNEGGSKNLTYIVSVTAPPSILYTMKTFRGVVDDMYLRVPCDATGNPKPEVIWTNATGFNLASDTDWYLVAEDGSLVIKNISKWAEGYYKCTVSNKYGSASEVFAVIVDPFPIEYFISIQIEEGKSSNIPCSVPHKHTDRIKWFKDNRTIDSTELHNVTTEDEGTYSCRVSSVDRPPQTGSTRVEVGFKPRFEQNDAKDIPYRYGGWAYMDCTADAKPAPQVSWVHDGAVLEDASDFNHHFMMIGEYQKGTYTCIVKNQYGYAQKDFIIHSADAA